MAGLTMFANVYRAMRQVGLPDPRKVDELELWEVAVLIGADDPDAADGGPPHVGSGKYDYLHADLAYREQMAQFAAGERDAPPDRSLHHEWGDPDGDEMELMRALASGSSLEE